MRNQVGQLPSLSWLEGGVRRAAGRANRGAKNRLTTDDASQRPVTKGSRGMEISNKAMQCVGGDS